MARRRFIHILAAGAVLASAAPLAAVIRVDMPVTKVYAIARSVAVGAVVGLNPDTLVADVRVDEVLRGEPVGPQLRIQVAAPEGLFALLGKDAPAVIFVARARDGATALVHLADAWLLAERSPSNPSAWRVLSVHDLAQSFPGRTEALVRIVREIQQDKCTLASAVENVVFRGGPSVLAQTVSQARFLLAADLDGDGPAEVLVGNQAGVQLLHSRGGPLADVAAAWGLAGARGAWAACGDADGDGRSDLLIGGRLWINAGGKFAPGAELDIPDVPLTVAFTPRRQGGCDVLAVYPDGRLLVLAGPGPAGGPWKPQARGPLWTGQQRAIAAAFSPDWGDTGKTHLMVVTAGGIVRYALDDDGGPPADHIRLTGRAPAGTGRGDGAAWKPITGVPIDIDGDGRLDYLLAAEAGGELLVNRGFGAFLVNPDAALALQSGPKRKVPWERIAPDMLLAAGDIHADRFDDLLILTPDGKLYLMSNTPFQKPGMN